MRPANERRCYNLTSSLIGWAHTQNDPWASAGTLLASLDPYLYGAKKRWNELVSPLFCLSYDIIYIICCSFVVAWNNNIFGYVIYNISTWMYDSWLPRPLWTPICAILAYLPKWHIDASAIVVINCLDNDLWSGTFFYQQRLTKSASGLGCINNSPISQWFFPFQWAVWMKQISSYIITTNRRL